MQEINKETFAISALWRMLETLSTKGVSMVISILLARLLLPEDYGILTLTTVFINLSAMFVQGGLNTALIREKEVDDADYTNAFFLSLAIAAACYCVVFAVAPFVAAFYEEPQLKSVLRVQMLSMILCSFGVVNSAVVVRELRFKLSCVVNLIANLLAGGLGIWMAYRGYGAWALVFHTLFRDGISTLLLMLAVRWKPTASISLQKIKRLISFSGWVLLASLLDFLGNNVNTVVFGKHYTIGELGYAGKGNMFPELLCLHTFGAITTVLLPAMAQQQDDKQRLKQTTKKLMALSTYVIFPMMAGLCVVAGRLIRFLYTEKWLPSVPFLWASAIAFGINPFRSINMQLIYALGDSKKASQIETIRVVLRVVVGLSGALLFGLSYYAVSFALALSALVTVLQTQSFAKRSISYGFVEWLWDMLPAILLTAAMCAAVLLIGFLPLGNTLTLFAQIVVGILTYVLLSLAFRVESFYTIYHLAFDMLRKKRKHA